MSIRKGTSGDDIITAAKDGENVDGLAGNDQLYDGAYAVKLYGGLGDDVFHISRYNKAIGVELAGQGYDVVEYGDNGPYRLGANIEELRLLYSASGIGNALDNVIIGSDYEDILDGGKGADTLAGGKGNDIYFVDNVRDVVKEAKDAGADEVRTSVSYTIGANVETLTLLGSGSINGTGNSSANYIIGNSGSNVLTGGGGDDLLYGNDGADTLVGGLGNDTLTGGTGVDTLFGGKGNDHYVIDDSADKIVEIVGGLNSAKTTVSYVLPANVGGLFAADYASTAAIDLTGNASDNFIAGNAGQNVIKGGAGNDILLGYGGDDALYGGAGNDFLVGAGKLTGGTGADQFYFGIYSGLSFIPIEATDFAPGIDKIVLNSVVLLGADYDGPPSPEAFYLGSAAHSASDRLIYDQATGNLYFDSDGTGDKPQALIGSVAAGTALTAADIEFRTDAEINQPIITGYFSYIF